MNVELVPPLAPEIQKADQAKAIETGFQTENQNLDGPDTINGQLWRVAERLIGKQAAACEFPAGPHRQVARILFTDGSSVIAVRRTSSHRAELELNVLAGLSGTGVPNILADNGLIVIQEDVGSQRLSEGILEAQTPVKVADLMQSGLGALLEIHGKARNNGLAHHVPLLGADDDWVRMLIDRPALIGSHLDYSAPAPQVDEIFEILSLCDPQFVKWDARPANAIARRDGSVSWIDWEHCGARNSLDDVVWFMCDETVTDDFERDIDLINEFAPRFASGWDADHAREYLIVMGVFHFSVRLCLILDRHDKYGWANAEKCAKSDKIGSSAVQAETVCKRAASWSYNSYKTEGLAAWFDDLSKVFSAAHN